MMMTMPDSTTREVAFKNNQMTIAGKPTADGKMAVMNNGQMMDVRMTGGKLMMAMPDNSMTEIKIADGQIVMVPDAKNSIMMMQMPDGTRLPVTMKNGKLMVVMPELCRYRRWKLRRVPRHFQRRAVRHHHHQLSVFHCNPEGVFRRASASS